MIMGVQISFWVPLFNSFEYKPEVELLECVVIMGFPGGSDGKESACNAGDQGLIPVSGSSHGRREWQSTPVIMCLVSLGPVVVFSTGPACYILATSHSPGHLPFFKRGVCRTEKREWGQGCGEIGTLVLHWQECNMQALWKTPQQVLKILNT